MRLYFPNHEDVLSPENFFKVTRPAFFFFDVQRRSGTDIVKLINYFYHGRLKAGRDTRGLVIEDDTQGLHPESRDAHEGDITNSGEVNRVIYWVNDLMNAKKLGAKDIAVISPYKKQVAEIDLALLDFATLHSFLKSFEEKGILEGSAEALLVVEHSKAIKTWLLEREIQRMKADEARFDLTRAKQRADEKLTVLLTRIRDLSENPSPAKIKAFREMLGIGENFVTLKDIQEFQLRTLTVDSSIGQEFKAVILSWLRSNLKKGQNVSGHTGNAGFMADPVDGMRRVNVATSRAQDILINIWDRQTFTRNKDADVRNWAKHTAGIFDDIRRNPVEWDSETQRVRNEMRVTKPETPETTVAKRSELREIVQPALVALASRDGSDIALQAARQLVAGVEQYDMDALLQALTFESQSARYLRILKQGYDVDQRTIQALEIESLVRNKHRRHHLNIQDYLSDYLEQMKTYFEARLTDPSDDLKQLNFSFAFEMDERTETQKMILEYVRMVKELQDLEQAHDVKIQADIRLILSENAKKEISPAFRSAIEETRVAHFFELQDNALTAIHMDDYFKRNPQALAYLFSDRGRSLHHSSREVHSRFEALNTLPVTLMMTNFMAAEQIEKLTDDYLIRLPHRLPYPDAITYNGQNLEVTSQALELIYQIQARQLVATMA